MVNPRRRTNDGCYEITNPSFKSLFDDWAPDRRSDCSTGRWPKPGESQPSVGTANTDDAFATARDAARTEGIWTGPSGGANMLAAMRLARELGPGHRVVTVQPDSGLKYLGSDLYG